MVERHGQGGKMLNSFKIYKGKKVFITGHSGFKGSWLTLWLNLLGCKVYGYSLKPNTIPNLFEIANINKYCKNIWGDILDSKKLEDEMQTIQPDIIFHLAAQPLVRLSYKEPLLTYQTNVIGILNILQAAKQCNSVKAVINVTTDKCYENIEGLKGYKEDDKLGGYDMYSSSKACSEILSSSYRRSFLSDLNSYGLATARAGNVIGGGDWSEDRLVPDCIRSIEDDKSIVIRNPHSVRPWQHVLEPLSGYILLGAKLLEKKYEYATAFNFGPYEKDALKVIDVVENIVRIYEKGTVTINNDKNLHEANLLMLNIEKAKEILSWKPQYTAIEAIEKTVAWYKNFYHGNDMEKFSIEQIKNYEVLL